MSSNFFKHGHSISLERYVTLPTLHMHLCCDGGFEPAALSERERTALTNEDDITSGFSLMGFWLHFRGPRGPQRCRYRYITKAIELKSCLCVSWVDACSFHLCTHCCCFFFWTMNYLLPDFHVLFLLLFHLETSKNSRLCTNIFGLLWSDKLFLCFEYAALSMHTLSCRV